MRRGCLVLLLVFLCGCAPAWYRRSADKETYGIVNERRNETVYPVANISDTPPPPSRLYDPFDPDHPPLPPDDPAASQYLKRVYGMRNSKTFHKDGDAPFIEDPNWINGLEMDKDGKLVLTPDRAVELGVRNSRDYQDQLDQLYLAALNQSLNRFDFDAHWYGTNDTIWDHFGSSDTEVNTLTTTTDFGFTRNFAAGGQMIFDVMNSIVFTFSGVNQMTTTSTIGVTLMQPLLRGFGRRIRLEQLTEGERAVLYAVRTFARYRKTFYVNLTTNGYLSLLLQLQNTRDLEANLKSQEVNLRLNEALLEVGSVSIVQVDQAFVSFQQAKLSLVQAQANLQTSLDLYKLTLGLPPTLPVDIDDAALKPFQLQDPELVNVQDELDLLIKKYREFTQAPPTDDLRDGYVRLRALHGQLLKQADVVEGELQRWRASVGKGAENEDQAKRERETFKFLREQLPKMRDDWKKLGDTLDKAAKELDDPTRGLSVSGATTVGVLVSPLGQGPLLAASAQNAGEALQRIVDWDRLQTYAQQAKSAAADLYVVQTQIRVYLIELKPVPATRDQAIAYARENRLDLMNERATVVDTWRQVAVTADALRAGLTVTAKANVTTPPGGSNPVDFRASASDYNIGFAFDSPLNRLAQRNAYRTAQINYEHERRNFMALDDQIQTTIRNDMRTLETERTSFAIARQSLISAARQVENANLKLLQAKKAADSPTVTQDVLTALSSLLSAKQTLISSWISYETTRIQLLLDMEALQVDERGIATDERHDQSTEPLPFAPGFPCQPPSWFTHLR